MTFISDTFAPRAGLSRKIASLSLNYRSWQRQRSLYRRTFTELSALTDRDLADLNISRPDIPAIARQASLAA